MSDVIRIVKDGKELFDLDGKETIIKDEQIVNTLSDEDKKHVTIKDKK